MLKKLQGLKTYICIVLIVVSAILNYFSVVDAETHKTLLTIFGALALAAIKAGHNRIEKAAKEIQEKSLKKEE